MALEFDLACQFALNRFDMEIEKMRLSVWGVTEVAKPGTKNTVKPKTIPKSQKQTMTAKDIMRNYK